MSLSHILASPSESNKAATSPERLRQTSIHAASDRDIPVTSTPKQERTQAGDIDERAQEPGSAARRSAPAPTPTHATNPTLTASITYTSNKMKHLKKEDGIPLWRADIQYEFLRNVFYDQTKCFTKHSENKYGFTFAEIYIDAMAKSSKCSKILKEKLLSDTDSAIHMAMVCLLVNLGRMNTTLNFFPEMRAQLRTYHSIPALQAHQDPNAYKQLQDAPRLKSILKGATEDEPQPWTMEDIRAHSKPRTNAVNLIFVMSQIAPKLSDMHFPPGCDFYDFIMRPTLSSASRARAFLWLLWWYLESDFTLEDSKHNPFGPGQYAEGREGSTDVPMIVPPLEALTEEQAEKENVDTEEEKQFGELKRKERIAILASEPSPAMVALKRARKEKGIGNAGRGQWSDDEGSETGWSRGHGASRQHLGPEDDNVQTRSPSPFGRDPLATQDMQIRNMLNVDDASGDDSPANTKKGLGRGNWRRSKTNANPFGRVETPETAKGVKILPNIAPDGSSKRLLDRPMSPGLNMNMLDHIPTPSYQAQKRHRGVTQHQSALNNHRRAQMDYMLDRSIRDIHIHAKRIREKEGAISRAYKRMRSLPADYDSEEESIKARKSRDRDKDDDYRGQRGAAKDADDNTDSANRRPKTYLAGIATFLDDGEGDIGEEVRHLASVMRKACRRLDRWQSGEPPGDALIRRRQREAQGKLRHRSAQEYRRSFDIDMAADADSDA